MTSLPLNEFLSKEVRPPLVALPTLWDCSLRESEAELRAEVLLVEDELPICLATLLPVLLVEEDAPLTEEEDLLEDELLVEEPVVRLLSWEPTLSVPREEDLVDEEAPLTDEDDLLEDELLVEEPVVRLLS